MTDASIDVVQPPRVNSRLDAWLTAAVWLLVATIIAFSSYFAYSVYSDRRQAQEASAAFRLIRALEDQVRKDPNSALLRVRLGEAMAAARRYPEAVEQFNAALKIEPKHPGAYLDLAQVAMIKKEFGKAESYLQKVVEITATGQYSGIDKRLENAYFHLGEIKLLQKEYEEAAGFFKESLRIRSDASDTYVNLARAYRGLGDDQSAIDNLKIAITFDTNYAEANYLLGEIYKEQGDHVLASYHYRRAADLAPKVEIAQEAIAAYGPVDKWLKDAEVNQAAGRDEAALDAAKIAWHVDPANPVAASLLAQMYIKGGKLSDAAVVYTHTLGLIDDAKLKKEADALNKLIAEKAKAKKKKRK